MSRSLTKPAVLGFVAVAAFAAATTASAQPYGRPYYDDCEHQHSDATLAGTIFGGITGAIIGAGVGAGPGAAIGGAIGGVVGAGIGYGATTCDDYHAYGPAYYERDDYGRNDYGRDDYGRADYGRGGYGRDYYGPNNAYGRNDYEYDRNVRREGPDPDQYYNSRPAPPRYDYEDDNQ